MPSEIILKDFVRIFGDRRGESGGKTGSGDGGDEGAIIQAKEVNIDQNDSTKGSSVIQSVEKEHKCSEQGLTLEILTKLKHGAWLGNYFSKGMRGLCWRVMLGKLSYQGIQSWCTEINSGILKYENYKQTMLPDLTRVQAEQDPLSGASTNSGGEWAQYYKVSHPALPLLTSFPDRT